MKWVTTWETIEDDKTYIVASLNNYGEGLKLGHPIELRKGWYVKKYMSNCYAALECPKFEGLTNETGPDQSGRGD